MKNSRILIVEDEAVVVRDLMQQLTALGYEVVASTSRGDEAVELAVRSRPDLVLMDIQLAGPLDGIGAARAIREKCAIPVVFLTAFASDALVEQAKMAGPLGYILKPFDERELRIVIEIGLHQHEIERRLQCSDERMQAMLRASMDSFWVVDCIGGIREVNDAACQLTGFERAELLQMNLAQLEYGRTPAQIAVALNDVMRDGFAKVERQVQRKDGQLRMVEMSVTCPAGPERLLYCFSRDITVREQANTRLQQLTRAVEQSPAAIVITDTTGRIEYVNPHFEKVTGYTAAEAIGQNPRVLRSGVQSPEFYRTLWGTLSSGRIWTGEFHNRRKDGTLFWEQASISPMRSPDGRITHYVAVKEDITTQKEAALERTRRESALTAIIENQNGLIWLKDRDGRFLTVNRAFARACGLDDPAGLVGKTDFDFWPEAVATAHRAVDGRVLDQGQSVTLEEELVLRGGDARWFEIYNAPVVDQAGAVIGIAGNAVDITERRRAKQELIRAMEAAETASRAKSAFLAAMSHELRTPLNVINGISATLLEQPLAPAHRQAVEMTLQSGHSLLTIIEEILDFSALQAGKSRLDPSPFELAPLLNQVIGQVAELPEAKKLTLTLSFDSAVPARIIGDARRLRQVLLNLLSNAVKFTERGGVHLLVRPQLGASARPGLHFSVVDTGIGIDAAHQEVIFQPFAQADESIKRRFGGTGLGLAISRSFIDLMGGQLRLRSRRGIGSAFHFCIPFDSVPQSAPILAGKGGEGLHGVPLLIAVTVARRRRMLAAYARAWGMDVTLVDPTAATVASLRDAAPSGVALIEAGVVTADSPWRLWLDGRRETKPLPVVWLMHLSSPVPAGAGAPVRLCPSLRDPALLARELGSLLEQKAASNPPVAVSSAAVPLGQRIPLSILAADDIQTNRQVLAMMLRHLGYGVKLVVNGLEVLDALREQHFDLVLLDVQMPVMDGLTAAREICRAYPKAKCRPKIVALTANALQGDREICLAAGMDEYLTKPLVPATLAACIQKLFFTDAHWAGETTPAVPPVEPNADQVWIDEAHLSTITQGLPEAEAGGALAEMHASAVVDFARVFPQVESACADRNLEALALAIHGLKGCFQMLGWRQAAELCVQALAEVRSKNFTRWDSFPTELHQSYQTSHREMNRYHASPAMLATASS